MINFSSLGRQISHVAGARHIPSLLTRLKIYAIRSADFSEVIDKGTPGRRYQPLSGDAA
jgi:hypothetical protein